MMWRDLLGLPLLRARRLAAGRARRYRLRHAGRQQARDRVRRLLRAQLYRSGGTYYERRKADPVERIRQRERQREARHA